MRWIGSPRDSFSRPLAIGLTTMGLAGLLVATVPGAFSGAASAGPTSPSRGPGRHGTERGGTGRVDGRTGAIGGGIRSAAAAPSAAPSGAPATLEYAAESEPPSTGDTSGVFTGEGREDARADTAQRQNEAAGDGTAGSLFALRDDPSGVSTLLVVAGTLLIVGLGLFALRWSARRLDG